MGKINYVDDLALFANIHESLITWMTQQNA